MTGFDDQFDGLGGRRPLSPELRERLQAAIVAQAGPLSGIDAPRVMPEPVRANLERALAASRTRRPAHLRARLIGVAAALVFLAGVVAVAARDDAPPRRAAISSSSSSSTARSAITQPTLAGPAVTTPVIPPPPPPRAEVQLVYAPTCDDLLDYLKANGAERVTPYGLPSYGGGASVGAGGFAPPVPNDASNASAAGESSAAHSSTNNQEAGVDEPDAVQNNGSVLFVLRTNALEVVDISSGQPALMTSMPVPDGTHWLFLAGDRLLLLGTTYVVDDQTTGRGHSTTSLTVVDVSDPAAPVIGDPLNVDGGFQAARLVDGLVRLVVSSPPVGLPFSYPTSGDDTDAALARNRDVIDASTIEQWIGNRPCGSVGRPADFSGFDLTTVYTIDPSGPDASESASVIAGGQIVYSSTDALYVTTTDYSTWQASDPSQVPTVITQVHQFDISGRGPAAYIASGQVGGWIISPYSLSERNGDLRIATSDRFPQPDIPSSSAVTVLRPIDGLLTPVGLVGGLGDGQSILGVRFVGDLGFVVTFLRRDPLYVIDLRDPTAPAVRGALDASGYSAYLYPMAPGFLVGVGRAATDDGVTTGVQVSVFDVRDPDQPGLVGQFDVGGAFSPIDNDPHAFLYWSPLSLAVVPLTSDGTAVLVQADADGPVELGRVAHPDGTRILRSVVANGAVFTVSYGGVLATTIDGLVAGTWVPFPG